MIPAQQRLEAGDRAVLQPDDRLVHDLHLLPLERPVEVALEGQRVGGRHAQRRAEGLDPVAAEALGEGDGDFRVLDEVGRLALVAVVHGDADRGGEEDLAVAEGDGGADRAAHRVGEGGDTVGGLLGDEDDGEMVAFQPGEAVERLQQAAEPARDGEQDRIADREAEALVHLAEAVDVDEEDRRPRVRLGLRVGHRGREAVEEELAVRQAREVVVHGVVQQTLLCGLGVGNVEQRADAADHLAVVAEDGPRAQAEPLVVPIVRPQAETLREAAAAGLDHRVERRLEAVAVLRMQHLQPVPGRALQRPAGKAQALLGLGGGVDAVPRDVPVPDDVAGTGERQGAPLGVVHQALGDGAAGEGVLHHREAEEQHEQHQTAGEGRLHHVVGELARHRESGARPARR